MIKNETKWNCYELLKWTKQDSKSPAPISICFDHKNTKEMVMQKYSARNISLKIYQIKIIS